MAKPDTNGRVAAKRVYDIKPMFQALHQKVLHVLNDDQGALNENLPVKDFNPLGFSQLPDDDPRKREFERRMNKINTNNGQIMVSYMD